MVSSINGHRKKHFNTAYEVLEQKLSVEDQEAFDLYQVELANQTDEEQNESNA